MLNRRLWWSFALTAPVLLACGDSRVPSGSNPETPPPVASAAERCITESSLLQVGAGRDVPANGLLREQAQALPSTTAALNGGACRDNRAFRFAAGIADMTGVAGGQGMAGYEMLQQLTGGIHTRLFARAFVIASPCNGQRVAFVSADLGLMYHALRQGTLDLIAADPELAPLYTDDNLMMSANHTHSGPGGYDHGSGNLFKLGYDEATYNATVTGLYQAIRRAHLNYEAHPQNGRIGLAVDELRDVNINRSPPAYAQNTEDERARYRDQAGGEISTNRLMTLLKLVRDDGFEVGAINWFGVHTTSVGNFNHLVSSDNKGYASLMVERLKPRGEGEEPFVAAFAQSDEGDASPNIFTFDPAFTYNQRGGSDDHFVSNAISGTKQAAKALALYATADQAPMRGGVSYRTLWVDMDAIEVTDPVAVRADLDEPVKRTCSGGLGIAFGAGAEDGDAFTYEGIACGTGALDTVVTDLQQQIANGRLPGGLLAFAALCNIPTENYQCHREKPVLLPNNNARIPLQIFTIGELAIIGLPWEVTTMAGRRIRQTVLDALAGSGVTHAVIAGLSNDYVHYLTTREEYSIQHYEGASTLFGPWTLAAVQQKLRELGEAMLDGRPNPPGAEPKRTTPGYAKLPPYIPSDLPLPGGSFGAVLQDVAAAYAPGETVRAVFQAGHPRNDPMLESSYLFVEREGADGAWQVIATDRDVETEFAWDPLHSRDEHIQENLLAFLPPPLEQTHGALVENGPALASVATLRWQIPHNVQAGRYRLRHQGVAHSSPLLSPSAYEGVSSVFEVGAGSGECPMTYESRL